MIEKPWWTALFGPIFMLAGVFLIGAGIVSAARRAKARATWPQVDGIVVADSINFNPDSSYGGSHSRIKFTTVEGREITASASSFMRNGFSKVGKKVPVWYDPEQPARIYAKVHMGDTWPFMLPLMGLFFIGFGLLAFALNNR